MAIIEASSTSIDVRSQFTESWHREDLKTVRASRLRHAGLFALALASCAGAGYTAFGGIEPDHSGASPNAIHAIDSMQSAFDSTAPLSKQVAVIEQFRAETDSPEQRELAAKRIKWEKRQQDRNDLRFGVGAATVALAAGTLLGAVSELRWPKSHNLSAAKSHIRAYDRQMHPLNDVHLVKTAEGYRWSDQLPQ